MVERKMNKEEKKLADRLKAEARADRPEFSEALHARICQAVQCTETPAQRPGGFPRLARRWLGATIAALLLIGFSIVLWRAGRPSHIAEGPEDRSPVRVVVPENAVVDNPVPDSIVTDAEPLAVPSVQTAGRLGLLVDSSISAGQWAYLDHDARVVMDMLIGQFPLDIGSIE
jgi:hypothetical protein